MVRAIFTTRPIYIKKHTLEPAAVKLGPTFQKYEPLCDFNFFATGHTRAAKFAGRLNLPALSCELCFVHQHSRRYF